MSDTPRTDAAVFPVDYEVRGHDGEPQTDYVDVVYEGFARTLERELNAANADLAQRTAEVADLKERLVAVEQIARLAPELNPNNYDHDEVCELNDAMIQLYWIVGGDKKQ